VLITLQCAQAIVILQQAATLSHCSSSLPHIPASKPPSLAGFMTEDALLALHLPLHCYCFDGLGFPLVCLHLLQHALYFLWIDFYPCLYIYRVSLMLHKDVMWSAGKTLEGLLITKAAVHITSLQCMLHKQPILLLTLELSLLVSYKFCCGAFSTVHITSQTNARESFFYSACNITRRVFCREICTKRDVTCTVEKSFACPARRLVWDVTRTVDKSSDQNWACGV